MDDIFSAVPMVGSLSSLDLVVVASSIAVLLGIAYWSGKDESDTKDFFVGGRGVPWVVACLSFVAAEISAVTIISVPGRGYLENWQYLQFFVGSAAARILVAFVFIPAFFKFECTTIYEFLAKRFGERTRTTGSVFFFITRVLASSVRLFLACSAVSVIMQWSLVPTLLGFTVVSIAFIAFGGIKAVMWTGAYEAIMFYVGGLAVAIYVALQIKGPWSGAWDMAAAAGRLDLWNLGFNLSDPKTLWGAALNAFFIGLAVFGTDQEFMQRLLSVKTRRASQNALVGTIVASLPLTILYLGLGTLFWVFYQQNPGLAVPAKGDELLPNFVATVLPFGLRGLMLAAILLASIDSPLASLSSSFVTDIYRPLVRSDATEEHYLRVSRLGVLGFGLLLACLAYLCRSLDGILWVSFQILTITGGSTLGVFLFGLLTKRHADRANVVAMVGNAVLTCVLMYLSEVTKTISIGWTWLIVSGTFTTFGLGWLLGPWLDPEGSPGSPPDSRSRT